MMLLNIPCLCSSTLSSRTFHAYVRGAGFLNTYTILSWLHGYPCAPRLSGLLSAFAWCYHKRQMLLADGLESVSSFHWVE